MATPIPNRKSAATPTDELAPDGVLSGNPDDTNPAISRGEEMVRDTQMAAEIEDHQSSADEAHDEEIGEEDDQDDALGQSSNDEAKSEDDDEWDAEDESGYEDYEDEADDVEDDDSGATDNPDVPIVEWLINVCNLFDGEVVDAVIEEFQAGDFEPATINQARQSVREARLALKKIADALVAL